MINFTTIINDLLDKGLNVGAVFVDLMKAFRTVDYELILKKNEVHGLSGKSFNGVELVRLKIKKTSKISTLTSNVKSTLTSKNYKR